jgi:hypothetical protein
MKPGTYVIAMDGFDVIPRLRVVMEETKDGVVCRTVESDNDFGMLFRKGDLRPATMAEFTQWQRQNIGFILEE